MKKRFLGLFAATMAVAMLVGCGSKAKQEASWAKDSVANLKGDYAEWEYETADMLMSPSISANSDGVVTKAEAYNRGSGAGTVTDKTVIEKSNQSGRKVIKNSSIEIQTLTYDDFIVALENKIEFYGAYKESVTTSGNNIYYTSNRYANYRIRVPEDRMDAFLAEVGTIGTVIGTSYNEEDITLQYVDTESRLETLKAERKKLLELLDESKYVGDTIELVNRISNVEYEIENYTSRLRTYDNKITYSTVTLSVREVERITTVVKEEPKTVWQRIAIGFKDNMKDIGDGIANFFVWFVTYIVNILFWCAVVGAIFFLIRRKVISNRKRADESRAKTAENKTETKTETDEK